MDTNYLKAYINEIQVGGLEKSDKMTKAGTLCRILPLEVVSEASIGPKIPRPRSAGEVGFEGRF
jgi:hypothetical protein